MPNSEEKWYDGATASPQEKATEAWRVSQSGSNGRRNACLNIVLELPLRQVAF